MSFVEDIEPNLLWYVGDVPGAPAAGALLAQPTINKRTAAAVITKPTFFIIAFLFSKFKFTCLHKSKLPSI